MDTNKEIYNACRKAVGKTEWQRMMMEEVFLIYYTENILLNIIPKLKLGTTLSWELKGVHDRVSRLSKLYMHSANPDVYNIWTNMTAVFDDSFDDYLDNIRKEYKKLLYSDLQSEILLARWLFSLYGMCISEINKLQYEQTGKILGVVDNKGYLTILNALTRAVKHSKCKNTTSLTMADAKKEFVSRLKNRHIMGRIYNRKEFRHATGA